MGALLPRDSWAGIGPVNVAKSSDPVCGLRSLAKRTVAKRSVGRATCLLAPATDGRPGRVGASLRSPAAADAKLARSATAVSLVRTACGIAPIPRPRVGLHAVHDFARGIPGIVASLHRPG